MENQIVLSMANVLTILGGFGLLFGWFYKMLSSDIKDVKADIKDVRERIIVLEVEAKNTNQRLSTIEGYLVPKKVFHFEETHEEEPPKES